MRQQSLRSYMTAFWLGIGLLLICACGRAEPEPVITYSVTLDYGFPATPADMLKYNGFFLQGRVVKILKPQWVTPTGEPPANPLEINTESNFIITPVIIEIEGRPIVDRFGIELPPDRRIVVAAFGGRIWPVEFATPTTQHFEIGEEVLLGISKYFFLRGELERPIETPAGIAWNVGTKYVITEDGMAIHPNPNGEPQPVAELIAALQAAARLP